MSNDPPVQPPQQPPPLRLPSLVLVNTGDGKGKSTAAFGTALRALARGWHVAVIQFLKSGEWKVGEEGIGRRLGIDWWAIGDGFTWDSANMEKSQAVAGEAWRAARETIAAGKHEMVVLDEITYPMNWGWIATSEVIDTIQTRPDHVNIIATGRDAPEELVEIADTVTGMTNIKHAFDKGVRAKKGIDY
ncbi:MAG TPA: cob(I)yrinic acid a,c-diamide adenosyltransferase [Actinomycetota bacterium]|nr:cob(I)yrinic acid a,c-diamide adenosyltransferase [Actinomycetota bacterium]